MKLSLTPVRNSSNRFLQRYHAVLFLVIAVGALIAALLSVVAILGTSAQDEGYSAQLMPASFDKATIEEITQLKRYEEAQQPLNLPANTRTNPFKE